MAALGKVAREGVIGREEFNAEPQRTQRAQRREVVDANEFAQMGFAEGRCACPERDLQVASTSTNP